MRLQYNVHILSCGALCTLLLKIICISICTCAKCTYINILTYIDYITEFSRRVFLFTINIKYEFQRNVRYRWVITIYILYLYLRAL